jgi:hypothetical protein
MTHIEGERFLFVKVEEEEEEEEINLWSRDLFFEWLGG